MPVGPSPSGSVLRARKYDQTVSDILLPSATGETYIITNNVGTIYSFTAQICQSGSPVSYTGTISNPISYSGSVPSSIFIPASSFTLKNAALTTVTGVVSGIVLGISPITLTATEFSPYIGNTFTSYYITGGSLVLNGTYNPLLFQWNLALDYSYSVYTGPYFIPGFSTVNTVDSRVITNLNYNPATGCPTGSITGSPSGNVSPTGTFLYSDIVSVYSDYDNNELLKIKSPCADYECPPGILAQEVPLIPGSFRNDAGLPLINSSAKLIEQFPYWFNKNKCSLLSRISRVVGGTLDLVKEATDILSHKIDKTPELDNPWLFYSCKTPVEIIKNNSTELKIEFYNNQENVWQQLYRTQNLEELKQSKGPCFYIEDEEITFHNLERKSELLEGSQVSDIEYSYTFTSSRIDDKSIYMSVPGYQRLRYQRWDRLTPEFLFKSAGTYISQFNEMWASVSYTPPSTGYLLKISLGNIVLDSTANILHKINSWDHLASLVDLERKPLETNYSLKNRIEYRNKFLRMNETSKLNLLIASELNNVYFYNWNGISDTNLNDLYSNIDYVSLLDIEPVSKITEQLFSVSGSKREFSSSNKNWELGYVVYSNNRKYLGTKSVVGGILYTENDLTSPVKAEYVVKNYSSVSGVLYSTGNLPFGEYITAIVTGMTINSLNSIRNTRLFVDNKPTKLLYDINSESIKKNPCSYGNIKWGTLSGRFNKTTSSAPAITKIALTFED